MENVNSRLKRKKRGIKMMRGGGGPCNMDVYSQQKDFGV